MKKEIGVPNRKFLGWPLIFWFTNKKTVLQNSIPNRPKVTYLTTGIEGLKLIIGDFLLLHLLIF
jgi:hypothetical protein